jgi:hypothetical protein
MGALTAILTALAISAAIAWWCRISDNGIPRSWHLGAWGVRIAAGFALMAVYTVFYPDKNTSDTWKYFNDAMTIRSWWSEHPDITWRFLTGQGLDAPEYDSWKDQLIGWNTQYTYGLPYDYRSMVRLQLVVSLVSFGHYEAHVVWMALLGWIGSLFLFRAIRTFWPHHPRLLYALLTLLPTMVFWSSGVAKEAPLWCAFGMAMWVITAFIQGGLRVVHILPAALATVLLISLKPYIGLCLLPSVMALMLWKVIGKKRLILSFAIIHLILGGVALYSTLLNPAGDLIYILQKRKTDFYQTAADRGAGSVIQLPNVHSAADLLIHIPEAFAVTYLRPWLWEADNLMMWAAALENTLILAVILLLLPRYRMPDNTVLPFWLLCISFILANAVIIGYSVPVLGAAVRYRFAALTMLCILAGISSKQKNGLFSAWISGRGE